MRKIVILMMIVSSLLIVGCSTHVHTIGAGPQSGVTKTARQYYILWGLVPINTVDAGAMVGDANNYEIQTQLGPVDVMIGVASAVTIGGLVSSRTVKIVK
jgi:hypothetical protein|tara:strand:+ start:1107 stop:1406 length:300 start_codon:yes stop_codon:yes gene_type:complete